MSRLTQDSCGCWLKQFYSKLGNDKHMRKPAENRCKEPWIGFDISLRVKNGNKPVLGEGGSSHDHHCWLEVVKGSKCRRSPSELAHISTSLLWGKNSTPSVCQNSVSGAISQIRQVLQQPAVLKSCCVDCCCTNNKTKNVDLYCFPPPWERKIFPRWFAWLQIQSSKDRCVGVILQDTLCCR